MAIVIAKHDNAGESVSALSHNFGIDKAKAKASVTRIVKPASDDTAVA